jgi:hypothetical protein
MPINVKIKAKKFEGENKNLSWGVNLFLKVSPGTRIVERVAGSLRA